MIVIPTNSTEWIHGTSDLDAKSIILHGLNYDKLVGSNEAANDFGITDKWFVAWQYADMNKKVILLGRPRAAVTFKLRSDLLLQEMASKNLVKMTIEDSGYLISKECFPVITSAIEAKIIQIFYKTCPQKSRRKNSRNKETFDLITAIA